MPASIAYGFPRITFICIIAVLLGGCDFIYGVSRRAPLTKLPDPDCVRAVVGATPGVQEVTYKVSPTIRRITWSGIPKEVPPFTHTFRYTGSASPLWGLIEIKDDSKGHVAFQQYLMTINQPPDPALVAASRTAMRHIELELEARCSLTHLPDLVTESCQGVECPTLTDAR